jgi:hypothetical protein
MRPKIKTVKVPALAHHEGIYAVIVRLRWVCPKCGGPRGEVVNAISFDGSIRLACHGWTNPCGHVDHYEQVREEARKNGLNK